MLLASVRAVPKRALADGFTFRFDRFAEAAESGKLVSFAIAPRKPRAFVREKFDLAQCRLEIVLPQACNDWYQFRCSRQKYAHGGSDAAFAFEF